MKRPGIGDLRHRVVLEAETRAPDGGGGAVVGWTVVAEMWAAIHPMSGGESVAAEAVSGTLSHVVVIRSRPGVVPAMRFRRGTRVLAIAAVREIDDRNRYLACACRENDL